MRIEILSIFPKLFCSFLASSLIEKASASGRITLSLTDIRDFADPPHLRVDDTPYGGGPGMVFKPEPLIKAIEAAKERLPNAKVIALTPSGQKFLQKTAQLLSRQQELILLCGRYEGIDQRVLDHFVDMELSIGDYVLMGGEIPAMVVIEAVVRLIDGVVGNKQSTQSESFSDTEHGTLLEAPQYTRPAVYRDLKVPEVLLCGDHGKIKDWRLNQALERTKAIRSDLLTDKVLNE